MDEKLRLAVSGMGAEAARALYQFVGKRLKDLDVRLEEAKRTHTYASLPGSLTFAEDNAKSAVYAEIREAIQAQYAKKEGEQA